MKTTTNRKHKERTYMLICVAGLLFLLVFLAMLLTNRTEAAHAYDSIMTLVDSNNVVFSLSEHSRGSNMMSSKDGVYVKSKDTGRGCTAYSGAQSHEYAYRERYDSDLELDVSAHISWNKYQVSYYGDRNGNPTAITVYSAALGVVNPSGYYIISPDSLLRPAGSASEELSREPSTHTVKINSTGVWYVNLYELVYSRSSDSSAAPGTLTVSIGRILAQIEINVVEKLVRGAQDNDFSEHGRDYCTYAKFSRTVPAVIGKYTRNDEPTEYSYTNNTTLNGAGKYDFTFTCDFINGTFEEKRSLTVDRTPPALSRAFEFGNTAGSVTWSVGKFEAPIKAYFELNGMYKGDYLSGTALSDEGVYTIHAEDFARNSSSISFIVDKTPPNIAYPEYTRDPFAVSASDSLSGIDKLEIQQDGKWQQYNGQRLSDNGAYAFRATDRSGNSSEIATAVLYRTDTFGNAASIRDGYKVNSWYTVNLPARIFTTPSGDVAGRYSFESYSDALEFAKLKEREYRVTPVSGGYMYVSAASEAVAQKYTDETSLTSVVEQYARGYISSRQTATPNGGDRFYTEPDSLTRNAPALPGYLSSYSSLERYFMQSSAVWCAPSDMYGLKYLSAMPYTVTATYLGEDHAVSQETFAIPKNTPFKTALGNSYRQGWYSVTEEDGAGNIEAYLIYSDGENPTLQVRARRGQASEDVQIDYSYTRNNAMYFTQFSVARLIDNVDEYITLKIERGSNTYYFTQSDELPVLGTSDYPAGKYTLTVYDRSLNRLSFELYIAGNAPVMKHSSLAADKSECRLTFSCEDRNCVVTEIALYKIDYNGEKTLLSEDGVGNPVSASTLTYTLNVGGKYGATVKDNFGRITVFDPVFYLKGLPQATLQGVTDGGRTNKNVSATFAADAVCELYVIGANGLKVPFTDYTVQESAGRTEYLITASDATSHEYLLYLRNAFEPSLYVEYTFEIDTILPDFYITDVDGNAIAPDSATNKPFKLAWDEVNVTLRVRTANGSITGTRYDMNTMLAVPTLYYFTLRDDVGNSVEFTVLLDNSVSYSLSARGNEYDGVLYFSVPVSFTVNEPTSVFRVENVDGYSIANGDMLTLEGRYVITVSDNYTNTVTVIVVLDFTPPKLEADGLTGGASNGTVTITASDYDFLYLTDRSGKKIRDIENGASFSEAGVYYISARDYAGNVASIAFGIDTGVDYRLSVPNGAITTEQVALSFNEDVTVIGTCDGEDLEKNAVSFNMPGYYELQISDELGNISFCVFVIVPRKAQTYSIKLPFGTAVRSVALNGEPLELESGGTLELELTGSYALILDCAGVAFELELEADSAPPTVTLEKDGNAVKIVSVDKKNVTLKLTKDGKEITGRIGQTLEGDGHYVLTATDELGNVSVYEFDIPYRLNTWAIIVIVVASVALAVAIVLIIRARRKPRVK